MIIGYVLDDSLDKPDGVQEAVVTIGEWMRSQGHEVHYLVGATDKRQLENIHSLAKTVRVKFNGNTMGTPLPTSNKSIKAFLRDHHFDVLHIQMPYSPFFAAKVIKLAPRTTKIIGTFHILPYGKISQLATKALGGVLKSTLKIFSGFVSVSEPAAKFAKASFGIESQVIPNPVDPARLKVTKSQKSDRKRLVFLGRLEERKGVLELVAAYRELLSQCPELVETTELIIGGRGPLAEKVTENLSKLPKNASSSVLGFVPEADKPNLLASADVAIFPSKSGESFGIVLAEAMACGSRIIIAGNNPGYASVLGDQPDLLFSPTNAPAFAKKIYWALQDSPKTRKLSKWLKTQAPKYDINNVGQQLLKLYSS